MKLHSLRLFALLLQQCRSLYNQCSFVIPMSFDGTYLDYQRRSWTLVHVKLLSYHIVLNRTSCPTFITLGVGLLPITIWWRFLSIIKGTFNLVNNVARQRNRWTDIKNMTKWTHALLEAVN